MTDWIDAIPSAWAGHRTFAECLVTEFNATSAIELGVDRGYSLFTFANAGIKKIYGIDLWEVDTRYGYGNYKETLESIAKEHGLDDRISLIQGSFSEVVKTWSHGKVDVLHIDGTHHYDDVKCDFESWFCHVKEDGVVLMHDVCVEWFTVKKYFNEISYPKAWFPHSFGLGVVCRDASKLEQLKQAFPYLRMGNILT